MAFAGSVVGSAGVTDSPRGDFCNEVSCNVADIPDFYRKVNPMEGFVLRTTWGMDYKSRFMRQLHNRDDCGIGFDLPAVRSDRYGHHVVDLPFPIPFQLAPATVMADGFVFVQRVVVSHISDCALHLAS